jgi:hypothetical protein
VLDCSALATTDHAKHVLVHDCSALATTDRAICWCMTTAQLGLLLIKPSRSSKMLATSRGRALTPTSTETKYQRRSMYQSSTLATPARHTPSPRPLELVLSRSCFNTHTVVYISLVFGCMDIRYINNKKDFSFHLLRGLTSIIGEYGSCLLGLAPTLMP